MTFKDLALSQDMNKEFSAIRLVQGNEGEATSSVLAVILANQSPVMKLWFAMMLMNLVVMILLF